MWNPFRKKETKPVDPLIDALYERHVCPDCGGGEFTMGPQGGMCQNIKCSNPDCGSEFNLAPFEDGQWLDSVFICDRVNRSEQESMTIYGRGYGFMHPNYIEEEKP